MVGWKRHLHRNPEVSFHEKNTARFVREALESFGGLEVSRLTENSVVARLVGARPGRTLAVRADIDALPITEENDFEFASRNPGVMHACGHDGHTAMLLGAAKVLSGMREALGGEDFSAYGERAPAAFYLIGAGNEARGITAPHHHPRFTVDEDALAVGLRMHLAVVTKLLGE